jgi:superfamily I DNA/RNA helicase
MLELPDFDALSTEQEDVLDIPLGQSSLIVGPPGTGKTVMAIYRAEALHKAGHETLLLMYNRLLSTYTKSAVKQRKIDGAVATYHSWFPRLWKGHYGVEPPRVDQWTFDWQACRMQLLEDPLPQRNIHILVDEGQDMPRQFYMVLSLVAASLTVFADENQRIASDQSTIEEIREVMGIDKDEVRTLRRNYRNTRPIAQFAASFYTGLRSGIPDLPPSSARGEKPLLYNYDNLYQELDAVVTYERNFPDHTIGVLVPYQATVRKVYNRLKDKTKNPVQVYLSQDPREAKLPTINFAKPGVKIVTHQSAKGLEFHAVFLPELNTYRGDPKADDTRMKMYVLSSRAKRVLHIGYTGEGVPEHVDELPISLMEDRR